ncbi:hypothetical protein DFQ30_006460, partial [Apophysomyces sp. BC1015]
MSYIDSDDNWEGEVGLSDHDFLDHVKAFNQKRVASGQDKDLHMAFQRLQFSPAAMSDDETDSTFTSHHSDKFSVDEYDNLLSDIDDYMYDVPSPTLSHKVGPGIVTRLGHRRIQAGGSDDWCDDLEIPQRLPKPRLPSRDDLIDLFDDSIEKQPVKKQVRFRTSVADATPSDEEQLSCEPKEKETALKQPTYEPENDDDTYSDIEFPQDMSPIGTQLKTATSLKMTQVEEEEEDFMEGLHIDDDYVFCRDPGSTRQTQQRQNDPVSRLPRPSTVNNNHNNNKRPPSARTTMSERFKAPTYASRQREVATKTTTSPSLRLPDRSIQPTRLSRDSPDRLTQVRRRPQQSKYTHPQRLQPQPPAARRGLNGAVLMERPCARVIYGNGSELDNLDNLSDWREAKGLGHSRQQLLTKQFTPTQKPLSANIDHRRPWRHNMTRRKPTLIQPSDRLVNQEYNNMKYDAARCLWKGNESSILSFGQKNDGRRRPALITNKHKINLASKYTEAVVNDMVFDQTARCWKNTLVDTDDTCLDAFEDLDDEPRQLPALSRLSYPHASEFEIAREVQHHMNDEENEHQRLKILEKVGETSTSEVLRSLDEDLNVQEPVAIQETLETGYIMEL